MVAGINFWVTKKTIVEKITTVTFCIIQVKGSSGLNILTLILGVSLANLRGLFFWTKLPLFLALIACGFQSPIDHRHTL